MERIELTFFHCSGFSLVSAIFHHFSPSFFSYFVLLYFWGCYCVFENSRKNPELNCRPVPTSRTVSIILLEPLEQRRSLDPLVEEED